LVRKERLSGNVVAKRAKRVRRSRLAARAQNRRALRPFARVKTSFSFAKNRRNLIPPMRAQAESNKAAPGLCIRDDEWRRLENTTCV